MGRSYVLVSNEEQYYFGIEKIPLKILDKWMMKTTKEITMRIFQNQQVKKRWKDMQENIKKMVWKHKRMLVIGSEIKIHGQV